MKLSIIPVLALLTPILAIPSVIDTRTTTPPKEVPCGQNLGIESCCVDSSKQSATSPAVLGALGKDPRLLGFIGLLSGLPLIGGVLAPITAQLKVGQQCSSIGVLAINPTFTSCKGIQSCCYFKQDNSPKINQNNFISVLNNADVSLCPLLTGLTL